MPKPNPDLNVSIDSDEKLTPYYVILEEALKHFQDPEWLGQHSPLAAPDFLGPTVSGHSHKSIFSYWGNIFRQKCEEAAKTLASEALQAKRPRYQPELMLKLLFFDGHKPTILGAALAYYDEWNKQNSKSREADANFFNHRQRAIRDLSAALIKIAKPSLQLEKPILKALIGREHDMATCLSWLKQGDTMTLIGPSGVGKTSLAAYIGQHWQATQPSNGEIFWYTLRRGINIQLNSFIFALAYFFQQHGNTDLWALVNSDPKTLQNQERLLGLIRSSLLDFEQRGVAILLCIDEIDLLATTSPDWAINNDAHLLSEVLERLATSQRGKTPILFIGQKPIFATDHYLNLSGVDRLYAPAIFGKALSDNDITQLMDYTKGSPFLLKLCGTLYVEQTSLADTLMQIPRHQFIDLFLNRIRVHLSAAEQDFALLLSVFSQPITPSVLQNQEQTANLIEKLKHLGLLEGNLQIQVPVALKEALYNQITPPDREYLHLNAAQCYERLGKYTLAAYHYVNAGRPNLAIWQWAENQHKEINEGQLGSAITIFRKISPHDLATQTDKDQLLILHSTLTNLAGQPQQTAHSLTTHVTTPDSTWGWQVLKLRGETAQLLNQVDAALEYYKQAADSIEALPQLHLAALRRKLSWGYANRKGDFERAWVEIMRGKLNISKFMGQLLNDTSRYAEANASYLEALQLAKELNDNLELGRIYDAIGLNQLKRRDMQNALASFHTAWERLNECGDAICAMNTKLNLAWLHNLSANYHQALDYGLEAFHFFVGLNDQYYLGYAAAFVAESYWGQNNLSEAEKFVLRALQNENEPLPYAYAVFIMGRIYVSRKQFEQAIEQFEEAIENAQKLNDKDLVARALQAQGEAFLASGSPEKATLLMQQSSDIWQSLDILPLPL